MASKKYMRELYFYNCEFSKQPGRETHFSKQPDRKILVWAIHTWSDSTVFETPGRVGVFTVSSRQLQSIPWSKPSVRNIDKPVQLQESPREKMIYEITCWRVHGSECRYPVKDHRNKHPMLAALTSAFMVLWRQLVNQNQLEQLQSPPQLNGRERAWTLCEETSRQQDNPKLLFIHVEGIRCYFILSLVIVWLNEYSKDVLM